MEFALPNIADRMLRHGEDSSCALLHGNECLSYQSLREKVEITSRTLLSKSNRGECIGLLSANSFFWVTAYLGTMRAGRVIVPLPTDIDPEQFAYIASSTSMKHVFISDRAYRRYKDVLNRNGITPIMDGDELAQPADVPMPVIQPGEDLAAIMFTSGSTGKPKGVMVTHRNIACNSSDIVQYLELTPKDRAMLILPLHYCFGASLLHTHLMAGGSVVLNNEFMYPETVLDDMEEKQCTGIAGVPSTYQILLRRSTFKQRHLSALRWFQQAGGKLPAPFIEELINAFGHVQFFLMYGQTEATARLSYLPPDRLNDKLGSIGRGLPSTRLTVLKDSGEPIAPGSEEIGEIVASGDNITKGYWKDEEETAKFFREGQLFTGDLARVDEDGFIFVQDRARDFIKASGKRVGAKEVEDVISELPDIIEVAVIGVPHDTKGEAIKAFVVPNPVSMLSESDVRKHCGIRMATYKVPEAIVFLRTLPKNNSGKVLKTRLREMEQDPKK
jgi:long-chain acyl-CoA synthetase